VTLRRRLLIAAVACLVVVVGAFVFVAQRQVGILNDQLDMQVTLVADRVLLLASGDATRGPFTGADTGEVYAGAVTDEGLITFAVPASTPDLVPDLSAVQRAPLGVLITIGTSEGGTDMRAIVQVVDDRRLVVGQSTASIDEAIRSLWLSGMIATVAIAACFVLVGWWVNRLGVRPIRDATEVARAITAGRRDERVGDTTGNTEAATLGTAINLMLDSTAETEGRLRSFVADASHELRTPLTSLMGYADLHRQGLLASGEAVDDAMRRIRGEAGRMSMIVEHLFVLASLDEAAVPIERQRVDVAQLLEDVAADAGAAHPDRVIEVDTAAAVELEADRDLLFQAVSVFVSNAVVHTPVSSIVSLAARVDGSSLVIGVTDSGPGIAQEHLGRLFDRFYRVDPGRARTQGGSGLGLAIARSIAEAHGGSVAAASTVGVGSTFQLRLPLSAA